MWICLIEDPGKNIGNFLFSGEFIRHVAGIHKYFISITTRPGKTVIISFQADPIPYWPDVGEKRCRLGGKGPAPEDPWVILPGQDDVKLPQ